MVGVIFTKCKNLFQREKMKRFFNRIDKQFFWLLGKTFLYFLQFEFSKMMEGIYILRMHLTHDHIEITPEELKKLEEENDADEKDDEV
jgi:hypothetical protein